MSSFRRDPARRNGLKGKRKRMRVLRCINILLVLAFLSACSSNTPTGTEGPITTLNGTALPTAAVTIIPAPDATEAVTTYLEAMKKDDYETMYNLLTQESRDAITLEDFSKRWNDSLNIMSAKEMEFTVGSAQLGPFVAQVGYSITYKTALAGDIQRNIPVQ